MSRNVSISDYIRSGISMPTTHLGDLGSILRYRRLASKLERERKVTIGNITITNLMGRNGAGFIAFRYKGKNLEFRYDSREKLSEAIGMVSDEFIDGESNRISVRGKDVVDIGAYVADTAICYVANGARHVYAFEPYPYFYNIGRINIRRNGMAKRITLVNSGVGAGTGSASLDGSARNFSRLGKGSGRKRIRIADLAGIAGRHRLRDAVLKVDCEGCEYGIILESGDSTLRRFSRIQIEYHYGYMSLAKRLREAGFEVHVERPVKKYNLATSSFMTVGFISAKRI